VPLAIVTRSRDDHRAQLREKLHKITALFEGATTAGERQAAGRRYGAARPASTQGQRYSIVVVRAPRAFVDQTLWPEYLALSEALRSYLNEATEPDFEKKSTRTQTRPQNGLEGDRSPQGGDILGSVELHHVQISQTLPSKTDLI
jgi:hypothetical protein